MSARRRPWWEAGLLYQAYPRSFADSDGDGVGDLRGIVERLDHLAWLGVEGLWLNPIMPSPDEDWGYDIAGYRDVHPELGTLADFDLLVDEAGKCGIRILLDLVPNHTSDRHPWFLDARSSRRGRHRDWYVWADPRPDGSSPNNWVSMFGGPAWTLDERTGQYYLHNFLPSQPDLNWWNEEVREVFDDVLKFWFERGAAGFRIDVAHIIVKDRELRDNPPAAEDDHPLMRREGQRRVFNFMRPELPDVYRRWRTIADRYEPPRLLIGEGVVELEHLVASYGDGDRLHMTFNFALLHAPFEAAALRAVVEATEALLPRGWPLWTLSNHDVVRFPTRWCDGDPQAVRCALLVLFCLRGTPTLYYGDEIGMPEADVSPDRWRDPVVARLGADRGRDGARTPMQWSTEEGGGFTRRGVEPWLPVGDLAAASVEVQRRDPGSALRLCRDLAALRRRSADLREGSYASLPSPPGTWAWLRGGRTVAAVNLGAYEARLDGLDGTVLVGTHRERDGERVRPLVLGPREGAVVEAGQ